MCVLLAAAWLAAALASPQINNLPVPPLHLETTPPPTVEPSVSEAEPTASAPEETTEVESTDERTGLIAVVVLVVVLAAAGVAGWVLVRRQTAASVDDPVVVTRRTPVQPSSRRRQAVVEAVDAGITELFDTDTDPRKAVIGCWVRLEQAAAAVGAPRQVGDSPADLVLRLLSSHSVSPQALDALADVYREARYATSAIDERMRSAAVAALRQVRAELAAQVRPSAGDASRWEQTGAVATAGTHEGGAT